jgi:selenocysteine lyase/cysteine desulfurase
MSYSGFAQATEVFDAFRDTLMRGSEAERRQRLAADLIGNDAVIDGPFGPKPLVYADYVASGRALGVIERFILDKVLPLYANSHTEASYCGAFMTGMRHRARQLIAEQCGAGSEYAVIFAGSGATAGLNRLVHLFGIPASPVRPRVIIGPYEHHSNILPWRESGAEVVQIGEAAAGGPDLAQLDAALAGADGRPTICAFSAASNVTGILSDVAEVSRRAKAAGAKIVWDYAGAGPYVPIRLEPAPGIEIDAVAVSPHKFIGGPAASGVLIVRRAAVSATRPTWPGGGTVKFVSPHTHDYADKIEVREEGGTPNVIGDIRAALAFLVKDAIGAETLAKRNAELAGRMLDAWSSEERIEILGNVQAARLPIMSFRIRDRQGGYIHHQLVTRMLSDRFGIQARGGCACAGPYALDLLAIDDEESEDIRAAIGEGDEARRPGFVRLNLSVLLPERKVAYILDAVRQLAKDAPRFVDHYRLDASRAIFSPCNAASPAGEALSSAGS